MATIPPAVLPDTNFLLDYPAVHRENWSLSPIEILISETVMSELRGLANNHDPNRANKAKLALDEIQKYQGQLSDLTRIQYGVTIKMVERCKDVDPPLNSQKADHQLIAYARKQLSGRPVRFCAVLSNDKELCDIAEAMAVITVSRYNEQRFHQELQRKFEWWEKSKDIGAVKPPGPSKSGEQPKGQLDNLHHFARQLYRRIEAVGCRATVYLAPQKARIALTLEVLQRERNPEKQVVFVIVETRETAQYWAGEIRQQGKLTPHDVQIFGFDSVERLDRARVIIYRHDQIARRLSQHVARLNQANKRITAIVDGCDVLDPVELAILLYECDQFIGLNHYPIGYRRARGHRMLSVILRNRSLLDYSFADAECDGWGHPCDLYLQRVDLTLEERELWEELNRDYFRRRERAVHSYPELKDSEHFWEALEQLLEKVADPEIVDLIKIREQREQLAQIAHNKLSHVVQLIQAPPHQPYRRLIFDYARQWTPILINQLSQAGVNIAELPDGEDQRKIWDKFAGNSIDTLLVSNTPAHNLPDANINQLIILTPFRPMDEVISMIDWSLSHTRTKDDLSLNVLYVGDTPEEIAMLELAEASFNLRYPP